MIKAIKATISFPNYFLDYVLINVESIIRDKLLKEYNYSINLTIFFY